MIKISVITAVRNGERYIRETVESILGQRGDFELEYIVCDGMSRDRTLSILKEYANRCTVVSRKDGSPQEAINYGMSIATGDILAWLNADDLYVPGALQRVVETFRANPDKLWAYGQCSIIDADGNEIRRPITLYKNVLGYFYSHHLLLCENYINQPATFWRRQIWEAVGGLDTFHKAAFDYLLWLKMAQISRAIAIPHYLARFRRHNESISENQFRRQFSEELTISRVYGNRLHYFIHWLNMKKIIHIYNLLAPRS